MKRPSIILIPVLLLTLAVVYFGNRAPKPSERAERVPTRPPNLVSTRAEVSQEPEVQRCSWREVESAAYRQYVANLRRIKKTESTVMDIIVADVNRLFAEKAAKLKADNLKFFETNFWLVVGEGASNRMMGRPMGHGAGLQPLNRERVRLINDLVGKEISDPLVLQQPDVFKIDPSVPVFSFGFLPEPKRLAVNALVEAAQAESRASIPQRAMNEQSMQLRKSLSKKYNAELARILSPAEKLEYDARYSIVAQHLRNTLVGMQPTREEFLQIVALERQYYDEYESIYSRGDPLKIADKLNAKREVDAQLEQALGAERFRQLQRGFDDGYRRDTTFVAQFGLNQDIANDLYHLREDLRLGAVLKQPSVVAEQSLETAKAATIKLLGEEAYQRYINRIEGEWLTRKPNSLAQTIEISNQALLQRR